MVEYDVPHRTNPGRRRFERIYDALAAITMLSVLGALLFGGLALHVIGEFTHRNEVWAEHQFTLTGLQRTATFMIAPGNDVLKTKDVPGARATRDRALAELDEAIATFAGRLRAVTPSGMADQLANAFDMLRHERDMMVETSDKVFDAVADGQIDRARLVMVDMDQRLFELTAVITEFSRIFQDIQRAEFDEQQRFVRPIERVKYAIAAVVTVFAAGVFLYGIRLRRRIRDAEASEQRERARAEAAGRAATEQKRLATIGQVAATVSHELRNPLAAIRISTALLRTRPDSTAPEPRRALDRIEHNVQRCSDIIQDLLTFTEPKALRRESTMLDDWLASLLNGLDLPGGVELTQELASGDILAIDRRQLGLAIGNVVDNAAAALSDPQWTPPSEVRRRIEVRCEHGADGPVLTIRDNGPGIPHDLMTRVFEPLFTTRSFGVGLGLPIARQVLEEHGGTLTLQSEPGAGTTATLQLPREASARAAA